MHGEELMGYNDKVKHFGSRINRKVDHQKLDEVKRDIKRCALYDDFKDLYNKTLVPMQKFQGEFNVYSLEHSQMKEMIKQFDENLALKSNKAEV